MYKRVLLFLGVNHAGAQYEQTISLLLDGHNAIDATYANGYGIHVVSLSNGDIFYHLLGNDGARLWWQELPIPGFVTYATITGYAGRVDVVASTATNNIYWASSSDAGLTWPVIQFVTPTGSIQIDAVANEHGLHVVWENSALSEVEYVRRDFDINDWSDSKTITDLAQPPGTSGYAPKIAIGSNKVIIISFVTNDPGEADYIATRDGSLASFPIVWAPRESCWRDQQRTDAGRGITPLPPLLYTVRLIQGTFSLPVPVPPDTLRARISSFHSLQ